MFNVQKTNKASFEKSQMLFAAAQVNRFMNGLQRQFSTAPPAAEEQKVSPR